jgi:Mg-chelatase subunit ChlD
MSAIESDRSSRGSTLVDDFDPRSVSNLGARNDKTTQPSVAMDQLAGCRSPFLIGVRHHSAAIARVIPNLLDDFAPDRVLIELPPEFSGWLDWMGHNELVAPIALAASGTGHGLSFYPFADFSPELAAIRWAIKHKVPIEPCDLALGDRIQTAANLESNTADADDEPTPSSARGLLQQLFKRTQTKDVGMLWERLVETPGIGANPESIRRAGLIFGWALRANDGVATDYDRRREQFMRECIAAGSQHCAAIVGAYHAAALLPDPQLWSPPEPIEDNEITELTTALIPYSFEQLDERSGYPAGIRDPLWHQRVFEAGGNSNRNKSRKTKATNADNTAALEDIDYATSDFVVSICREMRDAGHPANAADGKEVLRLARDLAALRDLPAPGRGELIEAVQTCLTHGEIMGIGRSVAKSLESVLIGSQQGQLAPQTPVSGLTPHVLALFSELNLPGPSTIADDVKRLRLDPLRSTLDRARSVLFRRMDVCGIPYAQLVELGDDQLRENLTEIWDINWQHSTAAMIELVAVKGATIEQVCLGTLMSQGFLRAPQSNSERGVKPDSNQAPGIADNEWTTAELSLVFQAADCGMGPLVERGLNWIMTDFIQIADLAALTAAMGLVERIAKGHVPGLPNDISETREPHVTLFEMPAHVSASPLLQSAIGQLEGIRGSDDLGDASALLDLVLWFQQQPGGGPELEAGRLIWSLRNMRAEGSALMQGAGLAGLYLLTVIDDTEFGNQLSGWVSAATDRDSRRQLKLRLNGAILLASPKLSANRDCLEAFEQQISQQADASFLTRLPALRGGFLVLSPAARTRLLQELLLRMPDSQSRGARASTVDPVLQAKRIGADEAGRAALVELMPGLVLAGNLGNAIAEKKTFEVKSQGNQVSLADRWRLILGVQQDQLPKSCRSMANALDELYGQGQGEGARGGLGGPGGQGGGTEAAYPGVREWAGDLESFFGHDVCEEVLGDALAAGRGEVVNVLDTESVTPSIELLEQVLSMKGALPNAQTEKLRRLTRRIVDQLTKELSNQLRPALTGLSSPRPTSRKTRRLDLDRTIRANLHTARLNADGPPTLTPERFIFRQPSRRSMDWHITFVVDVSGSMEASVIYSAMMSAIFSALPAVSVQFLAFSTEVIDFTDRVDDPLDMLLEVTVGGGTFIGKGVRAARERLKVPARSIVILVTDFEEGLPVSQLLAEVRALVSTGATCLGLAALNDEGLPRYNKQIAGQVANCGMPVAALSPSQLARWVGEQIR